MLEACRNGVISYHMFAINAGWDVLCGVSVAMVTLETPKF